MPRPGWPYLLATTPSRKSSLRKRGGDCDRFAMITSGPIRELSSMSQAPNTRPWWCTCRHCGGSCPDPWLSRRVLGERRRGRPLRHPPRCWPLGPRFEKMAPRRPGPSAAVSSLVPGGVLSRPGASNPAPSASRLRSELDGQKATSHTKSAPPCGHFAAEVGGSSPLAQFEPSYLHGGWRRPRLKPAPGLGATDALRSTDRQRTIVFGASWLEDPPQPKSGPKVSHLKACTVSASFATAALEARVPVEVVAARLGNTARMVHEVY
jgi:hypothetical protein